MTFTPQISKQQAFAPQGEISTNLVEILNKKIYNTKGISQLPSINQFSSNFKISRRPEIIRKKYIKFMTPEQVKEKDTIPTPTMVNPIPQDLLDNQVKLPNLNARLQVS